MARIIITHFSGILVNGEYKSGCFYEGLTKSLIDHGNDVMLVISSDFLTSPWNGSNKPTFGTTTSDLLRQIKVFKPDLVISFNNSSIAGLENTVNCPIVLWDADSAQFFNDKNQIKKNVDRYTFFAFSNHTINDYKTLFGAKDHNIYIVPPATEVRTENVDKKYNISFIGSTFANSSRLATAIAENPEIYNAIEYSDLNLLQKTNAILKNYGLKITDLKYMSSGSRRTKIIALLMEHGCHIFGPRDWLSLSPHMIEIAKFYQNKLVYSLQHNQLIYNRSKISVNISHSQNVSGYPWRVPDILASNSVLLSDYQPDLTSHFGSKMNLQTYSSTVDAYDKAKKLLNNEALRNDIVAQSNAIIEESFRWHHRFAIIKEATGVNLLNKSSIPGTYYRLRATLDIDNLIFKNIIKFRKIMSKILDPTPKHMSIMAIFKLVKMGLFCYLRVLFRKYHSMLSKPIEEYE